MVASHNEKQLSECVDLKQLQLGHLVLFDHRLKLLEDGLVDLFVLLNETLNLWVDESRHPPGNGIA